MSNVSNEKKGWDLFNKLHGGHVGESIMSEVKQFCPDFAKLTIEEFYGNILNRPQLDLKTRELALLASCVTLGYPTPQLRSHLAAALTVATKEEVIEIILQTAFYAGLPAAANALLMAKEIFES